MTVLMSSAEACIPFDSMRVTSLPASVRPLAVLGDVASGPWGGTPGAGAGDVQDSRAWG